MVFRTLIVCCAFTFALGCGSEPKPATLDVNDDTSASSHVQAESDPDGQAGHDSSTDEHASVGDQAATDPGHAEAGEHASAAHGDGHGGGHGGGEPHNQYEDALHGNASASMEDPAEIRYDLAIWSFVVFALLATLLMKYAWGPITAALDQREQTVQSNIDSAREQNEKAAKLLADHETKLAGTAEEIRRMLDDARKDAETQKANILAEAQSAADSEKKRALAEIASAKNGALKELAEQSVDTAVGMAGSIVKRELKPDDHSSLISDALKHFPGLN